MLAAFRIHFLFLFVYLIVFQVLAALGVDYFERALPDIVRSCSHQKASVRDGYLTLFKVCGQYLRFFCAKRYNFFLADHFL